MTDEAACRWCQTAQGIGDEVLAHNGSQFVVAKPHETNPAVLIAPYRHAASPADMSPEEWSDLAEMVKFATDYLGAHEPHGYTIGWNVGAAAGQHIFHAHMHIICRFDGDPQAGHGLRDFVLR